MNSKYDVDIKPFVEELYLDSTKFEEFYSKFSLIEMRNLLIIGLKKGYTNLVNCYVEKLSLDVKFDYDVIVNICARFGFLETIKYLEVNKKVNLENLKDVILKKSSFHTKYEILDWILDKDLVTIYDIMLYNSSIGNLNIIKYYLTKTNVNFDINFKDNLILRTAGYNNQIDVLKYLHEEKQCDIRALGDSIFRFGAESGFFEIVKYSVQFGSDIHSNNDEAIRKSCGNGHFEIVKYLVKLGANINVNSNEPICKACVNGNLDLVKFLIDSGADINANNSEPLRLSIKYKNIELFNYLIENSANIYINYSNLLLASIENNIEYFLQFLLSKKIHLETDNSVCLVRVCGLNKLDLVKILLNPFTDINYSNGKPLCVAIENGHYDIVEFLLSSGANPNLIDNGLISQSINKYPNIVKLLLDFNLDITILSPNTVKKMTNTKIIDSYKDNAKISQFLNLIESEYGNHKIKYHGLDNLELESVCSDSDSDSSEFVDGEHNDNNNEPCLDDFDFDELSVSLF